MVTTIAAASIGYASAQQIISRPIGITTHISTAKVAGSLKTGGSARFHRDPSGNEVETRFARLTVLGPRAISIDDKGDRR